jgi:hypothetical protein
MRPNYKTLLIAVSLFAACAAGAAEPESSAAVWTAKEADFVYRGFTTRYTCDGLRDKIKRILLDLGARDDIKLVATGCAADSGQPSPLPRVHIKMSVLVPVESPSGDAAAVTAHWQDRSLRAGATGYIGMGDCELVEQVGHEILPLFTTRNVKDESRCVPHQLSSGRPKLTLESLQVSG